MGRGVNTGALSPVGGIGEIRMRANLCKENEQEEPYQQEGSSVYYRKQ